MGQLFAQDVRENPCAHLQIQIAKLHTFKIMLKRWIVERSFA
jgi:hypothetical protein